MTAAGNLREALAQACGDIWLDSRILKDVTHLCDTFGHRFAGSESERAARDYIVERFASYGLENVRLEPCHYTSWKRGTCSMALLSPRQRTIPSVSMVHAPGTPAGGLEAEVVSGVSRKRGSEEFPGAPPHRGMRRSNRPTFPAPPTVPPATSCPG